MEECLTKILVDLPNHWAIGGESMWARPLGSDLYELRNVPVHAYGLNFLDVVEALPSIHIGVGKPVVCRVVERGGHQTLRVMFNDACPVERRLPMLESLRTWGGSVEGATPTLFAIDVDPSGDYDAICARLWEWEKEGLLEYETCEERAPGSFDDAPEEPLLAAQVQ
jgi:hypothetical protein